MFIGHYGVSFALQRAEPRIPLWILFVAVQFLDVVWAVLIFLGIERARVTDTHRGGLQLDLDYMPYSHSLVAAAAWAVAVYVICFLVLREATRIKRIAAVAALAVFSHWLLDLVVHLGDLPIYDNVAKVGFGLWRDPLTALALESLLYFGAVLLYQRHRAIALSALGIIILAIQVVAFWGPVLPNAKTAAAVFLGGYFVLAAAVRWIERRPILRSSF